MISITQKDVYIAEQRHMDLVAAVETERLRSKASRGRATMEITASWMIALGNKMETWGCRLQSKYQRVLEVQQNATLTGAKYFLGETAKARNC